MLFALPATVLFGWIACSVAPPARRDVGGRRRADRAGADPAPRTERGETADQARDDGDLPAPSFVAVITARLLIRSAGQLGAADAGA
ncbi:hypothetical protein [Nocardia thailandica]